MRRKGQRRQRVRREPRHLLGLVERGRLAGDQARPVKEANDALVGLTDMQHREQLDGFDLDADLLAAFADHRLLRMLVPIDEAARQSPQPATGVDVAAHQQDSTGVFDDGRGDDFGITKEDVVAAGTDAELLATDGTQFGF